MIAKQAVIFDLDGVLTDTAELHYRSWCAVTSAHGLPFDPSFKDALRGLSRVDSLARVLGAQLDEFSASQRDTIAREKNEHYLALVDAMTPADLAPRALALLSELRSEGFSVALASSSKNALPVLDRLGIREMLDAIVDGHHVERAKPDPQIFILAAERLGVPRSSCVVVEDAESGVAAAIAAGIPVIGIGPADRVGAADLRVDSLAEIRVATIRTLLAS